MHPRPAALAACLALAGVAPAAAATFSVIGNVPARPDGSIPAPPVQFGGSLYGFTFSGGTKGGGTIYKVTRDGDEIVYSAEDALTSLIPYAGLLYGLTFQGSTPPSIFSFDPKSGTYTTLATFANYDQIANPLVADHGQLYGAVQAGESGYGYIFSFDTSTGQLTTLYNFTGGKRDGAYPVTIVARGNALYGITRFGGRGKFGTLFRYELGSGKLALLHDFTKSEGTPTSLIIDGDTLYGATSSVRGSSSVVFSDAPTDAGYAVLATFSADGEPAIYADVDGTLYGVEQIARKTPAIFTLTPGGSPTILHAFPAGTSTGAGLTYANGLLYGTVFDGYDLLYTLDPTNGAYTLLHPFTGGQEHVASGLTAFGNALYGVAPLGGTQSVGSIFKVEPHAGLVKTASSFTTPADGFSPVSQLVAAGGLLYGATEYGGTNNRGTLFSFDPSTGTRTVLYSFTGAADGGIPNNLFLLNGLIYGQTNTGGQHQQGTFFSFDPSAATLTTIAAADLGGQLSVAGGKIFDVQEYGGAYSAGALLLLDPTTGDTTDLYDFPGGQEGAYPNGFLLGANSLIYGTTAGYLDRGKFIGSRVYAYDPSTGIVTTLANLSAIGQATRGLTQLGPRLYGVAEPSFPGPGGIYGLNRSAKKATLLYSFTSGADGTYPISPLLGLHGTLYGTSKYTGSGFDAAAVVFGLRP